MDERESLVRCYSRAVDREKEALVVRNSTLLTSALSRRCESGNFTALFNGLIVRW